MVQYLDNNSGFNAWNANRSAEKIGRIRFSRILWWTLMFMLAWWVVGLFMGRGPQQAVAPASELVVEDLSAIPISEIKSEHIIANVRGLRVSNVLLEDYATDTSDNSPRVALLSGDDEFIEVGFNGVDVVAPTSTTVWQTNGEKFVWRSGGIEYSRDISVDKYVITVTDTITNKTKNAAKFAPYARIVRTNIENKSVGVDTGAIMRVNGETENENWRSLDRKSYAYSTTSGFAGFADQYWETVVDINRPDQTILAKKQGDAYTIDVTAGAFSVAPNASESVITHIFAGPRDQAILNAASSVIAGIDETVDYGWFWFLARPMLWALNGLDSFVGNYGIAIIIFTLIVRLLMWPLTRKSYKSTMAMQKMQPEMARIQKLYGNDKARMQMEMMRLYQTHKTSPMSGCLPMLIQIPIFFALYKALLVSVQMRNAGFLWISDLSAMDPYFILPILMGVTMWLQQRLQSVSDKNAPKNEMVAQTQRVIKWMPVLFTVMFAWMPAGLVLYWTVSNIFGIGQMYIIKKNIK